MAVKEKYFTTEINAQSPEELARRIADNESRGFELVASKEIESENGYASNSSYVGTDGVRRRYKVGSRYCKHRAIMRRVNTK